MKKIDKILFSVAFIGLLYLTGTVYADLTGTEGLAIDLSSAGAGTDFTIAFDPTELLGSRTWGDGSTDTIVWTFNRATGTDPTITFNSGSLGLQALTLTTDLAVAEGGTGASSFTDGFVLLGSGAGALTALDTTADGAIMIGDGTTDPVALDVGSSTAITILGTVATGVWNAGAVTSSGAIVATSGVNLGTSQALIGTTAMTIGNNAQTIAINSSDWDISATGIATGMGNITSDGAIQGSSLTDGTATLTGGALTGLTTPLTVAQGGSGAATFTDGGILLGSGAGAFTVLGVAANGQIPIGDGATDPVLATITGGTNLTVTNGAGSISLAVDDAFLANDGDIGTGVFDFGGADSIELVNSATPTTDATGEIALDTTITDHQPLWQYFDGAENMTVIAIDTAQLPAVDNEVVKYDAGTDKFVLEADATGGNTVWSDIGDPDNSGLTTITFDNAELSLLTGDNDAAASFFTIQNTDADHTVGQLFLLDLDYSADDGDAEADFIRLQDSGGTVMTIQQNGVIATDGAITSGGILTGTGLTAGAAVLTEAELETLDGITPGTAAASKTLVLDGSLDSTGTNSFTATTFVGALTGNASTVTTNANLTGEVTSVGNAATIADSVTVTGWVLGASSATTLTVTNPIKDEPKHMRFNIINPLAAQTEDNEICLVPAIDADITVTKIEVTLNAAGNEVAGDLKYADTFIGLANPVVINVFDTTSGVLSDETITSGAVAAGKAIYIAFDSAPNTAITQMCVDITFDYD